MITVPIAPPRPACFGVVCPSHSRCARYAAVGLSQADPYTIVTCFDGESFPLFVELQTVQAAARASSLRILRAKKVHHAHLHLVAE